MEGFRNLFRRVISRFDNIIQPEISPDLTVPDFTAWGYLKEHVYINRPYTIQELKNSIRDEIATTNQGLIFGTFVNFWRQCVASEGSHLQEVIYQSDKSAINCLLRTQDWRISFHPFIVVQNIVSQKVSVGSEPSHIYCC